MFVGIMKTTYADDFTFWPASEQIRLFPAIEEVLPWAKTALEHLKAFGLRASLDCSGDRLSQLIRNGEQMKISVLGAGVKELGSASVKVSARRQGNPSPVFLERSIDAACQANGARAASLTSIEGDAG
ncbi:MAG: hypothetical protein ACKPHT_05310 [Microcystis panniformis]